MSKQESRRGSFNFPETEDDERRSLFRRKAAGLAHLRKPRRSLAAFSELSLSRSSFRLEQEDER